MHKNKLKRREAEKKYRKSVNGKIIRIKILRKRNESGKTMEILRKYQKSPKGIAARKNSLDKPLNKIKAKQRQYRYDHSFRGWAKRILKYCKDSRVGKIGRRRCIEFSLKFEDVVMLWLMQGGMCAITGQKMRYDAESYAFNRPSIDRIDNNKGYNKNNIRLVWAFVNQARGIHSDEILIQCCKAVADNNKDIIAKINY